MSIQVSEAYVKVLSIIVLSSVLILVF